VRCLWLCLLLAGCTPKNPGHFEVPDHWSTCYSDFNEAKPQWELHDPDLEGIIEALPCRNLDLLIAAEAIYCGGCKSIALQEYWQQWYQSAADAAKTYVELRFWQERLALLDMQIETLGLVKGLGGLASSTENAQDLERLHLLKAQIPEIQGKIEVAIHHLSVLLGYAPGHIYCLINAPKPLPELPCSLAVGTPCRVLCRPDVQMAKWQGVRAYKKSVLGALESVENALTAYKYASLKGESFFKALQESYNVYLQTEELYQKGFKNYLDVQEARRAYFTNYEAYLQLQANLLYDYIELYKELSP
jgi:outer membrane protein TolC